MKKRLQSCTGLLQFSLPRQCHNGCFGEFLAKKYLRLISIFGSNKYKIWKNKGTSVMPILKVDIKMLPLFFFISFSMVRNIEICLIYVLDKTPKKQTQWNGGGGSVQWFQMSRNPPEMHTVYFMDYIRDGKIQGQWALKKTKERLSISPCLT